jgi:hypothetical protein
MARFLAAGDDLVGKIGDPARSAPFLKKELLVTPLQQVAVLLNTVACIAERKLVTSICVALLKQSMGTATHVKANSSSRRNDSLKGHIISCWV